MKRSLCTLLTCLVIVACAFIPRLSHAYTPGYKLELPGVVSVPVLDSTVLSAVYFSLIYNGTVPTELPSFHEGIVYRSLGNICQDYYGISDCAYNPSLAMESCPLWSNYMNDGDVGSSDPPPDIIPPLDDDSPENVCDLFCSGLVSCETLPSADEDDCYDSCIDNSAVAPLSPAQICVAEAVDFGGFFLCKNIDNCFNEINILGGSAIAEFSSCACSVSASDDIFSSCNSAGLHSLKHAAFTSLLTGARCECSES